MQHCRGKEPPRRGELRSLPRTGRTKASPKWRCARARRRGDESKRERRRRRGGLSCPGAKAGCRLSAEDRLPKRAWGTGLTGPPLGAPSHFTEHLSVRLLESTPLPAFCLCSLQWSPATAALRSAVYKGLVSRLAQSLSALRSNNHVVACHVSLLDLRRANENRRPLRSFPR